VHYAKKDLRKRFFWPLKALKSAAVGGAAIGFSSAFCLGKSAFLSRPTAALFPIKRLLKYDFSSAFF